MAQTANPGPQLTPSPRALQKALLPSARQAKRLAQAFGKVVPTEKRHEVGYVLIGGLAVALHGVERNTMDVDVCVVVSTDNLARLAAAKPLHCAATSWLA